MKCRKSKKYLMIWHGMTQHKSLERGHGNDLIHNFIIVRFEDEHEFSRSVFFCNDNIVYLIISMDG